MIRAEEKILPHGKTFKFPISKCWDCVPWYVTYICSMVIKLGVKRNLKWYAWRKKFLRMAKLSNSPFQNVRSFLCTYTCTYVYIRSRENFPVLWERGRDFKTKQLRVGRNWHSNTILLLYNPYFPDTTVLLRLGAIALRSNAIVNKNLCCF